MRVLLHNLMSTGCRAPVRGGGVFCAVGPCVGPTNACTDSPLNPVHTPPQRQRRHGRAGRGGPPAPQVRYAPGVTRQGRSHQPVCWRPARRGVCRRPKPPPAVSQPSRVGAMGARCCIWGHVRDRRHHLVCCVSFSCGRRGPACLGAAASHRRRSRFVTVRSAGGAGGALRYAAGAHALWRGAPAVLQLLSGLGCTAAGQHARGRGTAAAVRRHITRRLGGTRISRADGGRSSRRRCGHRRQRAPAVGPRSCAWREQASAAAQAQAPGERLGVQGGVG